MFLKNGAITFPFNAAIRINTSNKKPATIKNPYIMFPKALPIQYATPIPRNMNVKKPKAPISKVTINKDPILLPLSTTFSTLRL